MHISLKFYIIEYFKNQNVSVLYSYIWNESNLIEYRKENTRKPKSIKNSPDKEDSVRSGNVSNSDSAIYNNVHKNGKTISN